MVFARSTGESGMHQESKQVIVRHVSAFLCQVILDEDSDSDFEEDLRVRRDTARAGEELARAMEVRAFVHKLTFSLNTGYRPSAARARFRPCVSRLAILCSPKSSASAVHTP